MLYRTRCPLRVREGVLFNYSINSFYYVQRHQVHLALTSPVSAWTSIVHIKPNSIKQSTQHRLRNNESECSNSPPPLPGVPVRCITASSHLVQGERIAHISSEVILTGERAAELIHVICTALQSCEIKLNRLEQFFAPHHMSKSFATERNNNHNNDNDNNSNNTEEMRKCSTIEIRSFASFANALRHIASDLPFYMMASRDCLLITVAVFLLRLLFLGDICHIGSNASISSSEFWSKVEHECMIRTDNICAMQTWICSFPPRTPPLGLLLHAHYSDSNKFHPLQRRIKLGNTARLLETHENIHDAHKSLLLDVLQHHNNNNNSDNNNNELSTFPLEEETQQEELLLLEEEGREDNKSKSIIKQENEPHMITNMLLALQPTVEVNVTPQLMHNYYKGKTSALSERQHAHERGQSEKKLIRFVEENEMAEIKSNADNTNNRNGRNSNNNNNNTNNNNNNNNVTSHSTNAALRELVRLERLIKREVLTPLVHALVSCNDSGSSSSSSISNSYSKKEESFNDDDDEEWENNALMKLMEWNHFMMRSRVINLNWQEACSHSTWPSSISSSTTTTTDSNNNALLRFALVPFVDMLNHSHDHANVSFALHAGTHSIHVNTSCDVPAGQELCLHYGHVAQRCGLLSETEREWRLTTLLNTSSFAAISHKINNNTNNNNNNNINTNNRNHINRNSKQDVIAAEVEAIESTQKMPYGLKLQHVNELRSQVAIERLSPNVALLESEKEKSNMNKSEEPHNNRNSLHRKLGNEYCHRSNETKRIQSLVSPSSSSSSSFAAAAANRSSTYSDNNNNRLQGGTNKVSIREEHIASAEGAAEGRWLWRYGFHRSEAEIISEAKLLWSSQLQNRIARLTDVRRKGRPGEFVIGVPENLAVLREQRAQLERERYHNQRIFPPQREESKLQISI